MSNLSLACLECGKKIRVQRGQCHSCIRRTQELIRRGKLKEEDLVREGKMLPKSRGGFRKSMADLFRKDS